MKILSALPLFLLSSVAAFSPSQLNQRRFGAHGSAGGRVTVILQGGKVGIFFGTSTGATETVADLIRTEFGDDAEGPFDIEEIQGNVAEKFGSFDALVVGTPTWNTGADTERSGTGWDEIYYGEMQDLSIAGKKVAVFGLGDQMSYSDNYADASGELYDVFESLGCKMLGHTSQDGYEHEESKAVRGDMFCGLLCDEVNQDELSDERVQNWVEQLKSEGILDEAASSSDSAPADVVETPAVPVSEGTDSDIVAELERENARLRKMLEDSKMMDEVLEKELMDGGFVPDYNAKTGMVMWTSADGKQCYYTKETPKSP